MDYSHVEGVQQEKENLNMVKRLVRQGIINAPGSHSSTCIG